MDDTRRVIGKKILVADDDPDILEAVRLMLEMYGYTVDVVQEGKRVVAKMLESQSNILLLDIWMSGESGVDICQKIKKTKKIQTTPIILLSASKDIRKNSREAGATDYLEKPFEMEDLINKIRKYT